MEQAMHHSFDTYKHIKALISKGLKESQAEAIVTTIVESKEFDLSYLASKDEMRALKEQVNIIKEQMVTKDEMRAIVAEFHASTLKWMIGTMIALCGIVVAAVEFLK